MQTALTILTDFFAVIGVIAIGVLIIVVRAVIQSDKISRNYNEQ